MAGRRLAFHLQMRLNPRLFLRPTISTEKRAISKLFVSHLSSEAYADDGGISSAAAAQLDHSATADSTA